MDGCRLITELIIFYLRVRRKIVKKMNECTCDRDHRHMTIIMTLTTIWF